MFKKLLGLIGVGLLGANNPVIAQPARPYDAASPANEIYDQLFCDDHLAFAPKTAQTPTAWQILLYGTEQNSAKINELALDAASESRIRALAFNWLRAHGQPTPKGIVLGVIIEVPLDGGLDVLAVYRDGSVRYINHSGRIAVFEPGAMEDANQRATRLTELAQPIVARIGPWDRARLPPPTRPNIRLTFLVSDGLYFGQGPFQTMQQDALAGPLIQQGTQLVELIADRVAAK